MNTFGRYFCYFTIIGIILIACIILYSIVQVSLGNNVQKNTITIEDIRTLMLGVLLYIVIFALPMSWFFDKFQAKIITVELKNTDKEFLEKKIDVLVLGKALRDKKIVLSDTEIVYVFKNKLKEWLVNDIKVTFNENDTIVNVPIGYEKYFCISFEVAVLFFTKQRAI